MIKTISEIAVLSSTPHMTIFIILYSNIEPNFTLASVMTKFIFPN